MGRVDWLVKKGGSVARREAEIDERVNNNEKGPHDPYLLGLGQNIAAARQMLQMKRQTLAELSGITLMSVTLIEIGMRNASINTIRKIAEALGSTPCALLPDGKNGTVVQFVAPDLTPSLHKLQTIFESAEEVAKVLAEFKTVVAQADVVQRRLQETASSLAPALGEKGEPDRPSVAKRRKRQ